MITDSMFLIPSLGGAAIVVALYGMSRWRRQRELRRHVIEEFGHDVDAPGSLYVTRDGVLIDPDPSDGDQSRVYTDTHWLAPQEWVEPDAEGASFTPPDEEGS